MAGSGWLRRGVRLVTLAVAAAAFWAPAALADESDRVDYPSGWRSLSWIDDADGQAVIVEPNELFKATRGLIDIPLPLPQFDPARVTGTKKLVIWAWDVDDPPDDNLIGALPNPEIDEVFLNGTKLGKLRGGYSMTASTTFDVPVDLLRPGANSLVVSVDTANGGEQGSWAVGIDRVLLNWSSTATPAVFVRGYFATGDEMAPVDETYQANYPLLAGRTLRPLVHPTAGTWWRIGELRQAVTELQADTGEERVFLVGHSFGGVTSRFYAATYPDHVRGVVMTGAPNLGSQLAVHGCHFQTWPILSTHILKDLLEEHLGSCEVGNALFELQPEEMAKLNAQFGQPQAPMLAYAGDVHDGDESVGCDTFARVGGHGLENLYPGQRNDGWVPESSALAFGVNRGFSHVCHAGLHKNVPENNAILDSLCLLYPAALACGGPPPGGSGPLAAEGVRSAGASSEPEPTASMSAQAASSTAYEVGSVITLDVPAGGSAGLPMSFEGASFGQLTVLSDVAGLTGSIGSTALEPLSYFGIEGLAASLDFPGSSQLTLSNPGATTAHTVVWSTVQTTRRLAIASSPALPRPHDQVEITVSLSETVSGDAPQLRVLDEAGVEVASPNLSPGAQGEWTATWRPSAAGSYRLAATVSGSRPRAATAGVDVSDGAVSFAGGMTSETRDINGDEMWDELVVKPNLQVATAGEYVLSAELRGPNGQLVSTAARHVDLASGAQAPELSFDGRDVYASPNAGDGWYSVRNARISRADGPLRLEASSPWLGETDYYVKIRFQHLALSFSESGWSDSLVDVDGDGAVDELRVAAPVDADDNHGGCYGATAILETPLGRRVAAFADWSVCIPDGASVVTLPFPVDEILAGGIAGPYVVDEVSLADGVISTASATDAHTTQAYTLAQMGGLRTDTITPNGTPKTVTGTSTEQFTRLEFDATDDERVFIKVSGNSMETGAVDLRAPSGETVAKIVLPVPLLDPGIIDTTELPATGRYALAVGRASSGSVTIRLWKVPADVTVPIVPGGAPVRVTTGTPGQNARLTFTADAGRRVAVSVSGSTYMTAQKVSLLDPAGVPVPNAGGTATSAKTFSTVTLPAAGVYTVVVDPTLDGTGSIDVQLFDVPADATGTITADGPAVRAEITAQGQAVRLAFSGTAGETVTVDATNSTITSGSIAILSPSGATLGSKTINTSGGFVDVTTLPTSGIYVVRVLAGAGTGATDVRLYDIVDSSAPITPGQSVTASLAKPGENPRYVFTASAGRRFSAQGTSTTLGSHYLRLLRPDGSQLAVGAGSGGILPSTTPFLEPTTIPANGTYTLQVDGSLSTTGSTNVTLYEVVDVTGAITAGGPTVTTSTSTPGQAARLSMSGTAGQRVSIEVTGSTMGSSNVVKLLRPDGTQLASTTLSGATGFLDTQTLATTGTYTVVVDPFRGAVGSATLRVHVVPADVTGAIFADGSATGVTTTTPGQNARLTFNGTIGQRVSLAVSGSSFPLMSTVKLLKPDGSQLASLTLSGTTAFLDVQTLPTTGTYTVLVDPYGAAVGSATLRLYTVPADSSGPIVPGGTAVTAATTTPGQNVRLTFSGSAGERVSLSVSGSSLGTTTLKILKPDGSQLVSTTISSSGFLDAAALTVAGTHTVLLDPIGSGVGSATVQLHAITDVSGSISAGGAAVPVSITTPGQNGAITFSGTAGQAITLVVDQVTITLVRVSIQKPDGTNLVAPTTVGTSGKTITATPTVTGTHKIVIDPMNAYTGSLRLTLTSP